jgi:hypothetical protein
VSLSRAPGGTPVVPGVECRLVWFGVHAHPPPRRGQQELWLDGGPERRLAERPRSILCGAAGIERLGQDRPAPDHRGVRDAGQRIGAAQGQVAERRAGAPSQHRLRVPEFRPVSAPDRVPEHRLRAAQPGRRPALAEGHRRQGQGDDRPGRAGRARTSARDAIVGGAW